LGTHSAKTDRRPMRLGTIRRQRLQRKRQPVSARVRIDEIECQISNRGLPGLRASQDRGRPSARQEQQHLGSMIAACGLGEPHARAIESAVSRRSAYWRFHGK
jgi:hypothetical protein